MPYPTEHAARVRNPGDFQPNSFRSKSLGKGIRAILGRLKGKRSMSVQAYRFDIGSFTVAQARAWLKRNKVSFISFEKATGKEK